VHVDPDDAVRPCQSVGRYVPIQSCCPLTIRAYSICLTLYEGGACQALRRGLRFVAQRRAQTGDVKVKVPGLRFSSPEHIVQISAWPLRSRFLLFQRRSRARKPVAQRVGHPGQTL